MGSTSRIKPDISFFATLIVVAFVFIQGFVYPLMFIVGQALLLLLFCIVGLELFILFVKKYTIAAKRTVMNPLSMGDYNTV